MLPQHRIDLVVGTRPEAIKLSPVATALAAIGLPPRLILTGQHPIEPADHGLAGFGALRLACPGGGDPLGHAEAVSESVVEALSHAPPGLLVVQGDTSSALGGALAAERLAIPLAHVEAGLRSFDPRNPWPEEENRIAIDRRSALLLAPTEGNAANLVAEGLGGTIHVTGNSGIDALMALLADLPPAPPRDGPLRLLVTSHRRENWGRPMREVAAALIELTRIAALAITIVLHPNPLVNRSQRRLFDPCPAIRLAEPMDHRTMIVAMRGSDLILSDSGGVQEEAPALGVPLLVLRDKTERPEGIASGNMQLVGTRRESIIAAVLRLTDREALAAMAVAGLPFGDGHAAPRIAGHVADFLGQGALRLARRA